MDLPTPLRKKLDRNGLVVVQTRGIYEVRDLDTRETRATFVRKSDAKQNIDRACTRKKAGIAHGD